MLDRVLNSATEAPIFGREDGLPAGWAVSAGQIAYPDAVAAMEARAAAIAEGRAGELVWLLEHPPLYTAGVSAKPGNLLDPDPSPLFNTGRG
ncbi:MAG: lipoate-protein ligase B, partial [Proteobacteria bacterium]|nr:lipoate-protein ligase B [Pseudomonadota bacterium]